MKQELVKNWMSKEVIFVSPNTTLPATHHLMSEYDVRRLPVTDQGQLVGIITLGDVREAEPSDATSLSEWEANYLLDKLKVSRVMATKPITISPNDTLADAANQMLKHKVSGLPVINDDNQVVGIITESDIFRLVVQTWRTGKPVISMAIAE